MIARPDEFFPDQISRLSCLEGYPFHAAGVAELAAALQRACKDDGPLAAKIITSFTNAGGKCPDPHDIAMAVWRLQHPEGKDKPSGNPACPACGGLGFISMAKMVRDVRYDFSKPCSCRKVPATEPTPPARPVSHEPELTRRLAEAKKL